MSNKIFIKMKKLIVLLMTFAASVLVNVAEAAVCTENIKGPQIEAPVRGIGFGQQSYDCTALQLPSAVPKCTALTFWVLQIRQEREVTEISTTRRYLKKAGTARILWGRLYTIKNHFAGVVRIGGHIKHKTYNIQHKKKSRPLWSGFFFIPFLFLNLTKSQSYVFSQRRLPTNHKR